METKKYLRQILSSNLSELVQTTPLERMSKMSQRLKNEVFIKREDRQVVHSFKLRGAYNMIKNLSEEEKKAGVLCASAGNHAQGVAYSASHLGIKAIIVMPKNTPSIKVDAVEGFGAKVVLHGENFDEAKAKAYELSEQMHMSFIPPFDHPSIIVGNGTIARELLTQNSLLEYIFVPVGGGGLVAGIAVFIKAVLPEIKVIGVESKDSASMSEALKKGKLVELESVGIFADGVAVKKVGEEPFRLCKKYLDDVISVSGDEICAAMKDIFEDTRAVSEPSGALSLAGLKKYAKAHNLENKKLSCILSGANLNFHTLRYVSERCELGEKKEVLLAVGIPEEKGSFLKFVKALGDHVITEFNYRHNDDKNAKIFVGISVKNEAEKNSIIAKLKGLNFEVSDLGLDHTSKTHVRYMIGGQTPKPMQEELYVFNFPEHKGALLNFLKTLGSRWDISLFHYRAYGMDYGDVLVAFVVDTKDKKDFLKHLDILGYSYKDVKDSLAYKIFLSKEAT